MKSRPSSFPDSVSASSWFICFWPAEMKTSASAPSWIWVLRVPEESKSYWRVTSAWEANESPAFVRDSVRDAAAKTMSFCFSSDAEEEPPDALTLLQPASMAAVAAALPPMKARRAIVSVMFFLFL